MVEIPLEVTEDEFVPFVTVSPAELRIACAAAVPSSEAVPVTVRPELVRLEFPAVNVSDVTLVKEGSEASVSVRSTRRPP